MNWKDWSDGYTGKTLLQDWWKAVKTNFGLVKDNITELKGEVDKKAETAAMTEELAKKANAQTADGGFAAGRTAGATSGVAVGNNAYSGGKGASLGGETYSQLGGAVGYKAETDNGFAGGYNARTAETIDLGNGTANYSRITAVQLGEGLNSKRYTAQIFDYELVADDAEIPTESDGSKYLKDVGKLSDLQTEVKTDIVGAVNGIAEELTEKVDKESGKGLSTIDNISVMHSTYMGADGTEKDNPYATMTINRQNGKSNVEKIITHAHRETFDHPDGSVTEKKLSSELAEKINGKQDKLTFDDEPTGDSDNPVKSSGVFNALSDKVNTTDLSSYVKNTDYAGYGKPGIIRLASTTNFGIAIDSNHNLLTVAATSAQISSRDNYNVVIAPSNINKAVKAALSDANRINDMTNEEKTSARGVIGAVGETEFADLKLKSVPHKDVSAYPVTLTDHLADEEFIKCNVYGSAGGIGNLDSTDQKYKIEVISCGKNVLPYPYKDSSKTGNGINFTDNGDGSVSLTGTATGKATYYFARSLRLKSGTYTLSETMKNQSSNVSVILDAYADGTFLNSYSASAKKTTVITLSQDATVSIYAYVPVGVVCENYPVKPQLEYGTAETEYEPYTANGVTAALDTALGEGEYIDIINKKRYGVDGSATDITVIGSLKTADSAKNHISCGTTKAPSKIELSYWQDINKVLSETTNAILAQGGNV